MRRGRAQPRGAHALLVRAARRGRVGRRAGRRGAPEQHRRARGVPARERHRAGCAGRSAGFGVDSLRARPARRPSRLARRRAMNAEHRLAALRRRLDGRGASTPSSSPTSATCATSPASRASSTQASTPRASSRRDVARFYTDFRYAEAAEAAAAGTPWVVRVPKESLYIELCEELHERRRRRASRSRRPCPYGRFKFISEQFEGRVEAVDQWVEEIRAGQGAARDRARSRPRPQLGRRGLRPHPRLHRGRA